MMRPPLGMLRKDKYGNYGCVGCSRIMLGPFRWRKHDGPTWPCYLYSLATEAAAKAREERW